MHLILWINIQFRFCTLFVLPTINQTEEYINSVSEINNNYVSIYKNIILPIKNEGEAGVEATVKWAKISIVLSAVITTVISIIITIISN